MNGIDRPADALASIAPSRSRNWRRAIAHANLPAPIAALVTTITRRTRLWRSEKHDVAQEICAHFADGLAAGRTPDELLSSFGAPDRAARLIRIAKRRARPAWWHALAWMRRLLALLILVCIIAYVCLAARYLLGRPTLRHNYVAEINAPVLAVPADQRAWPVYLQAIRAWGPDPDVMNQPSYNWPRSPSDPFWQPMVEVIRTRSESIDLIRRAASLPSLGFLCRGGSDPEYLEALHIRNPTVTLTPDPEVENPMTIGVLLPHLGEMRRFARMLAVDAAEASISDDRARFIADFEALLGMTRQALAESLLISNLVGCAIGDLAIDTLLTDGFRPGLLSETDLTRLAHLISALGSADGVRFRFTGDRMMLQDFTQRLYSDNGRGDGHPIYGGLASQYRDFGVRAPNKYAQQAVFPVLTAAIPSRAEFDAMIDRAITLAEADQTIPMWRRSERRANDEYNRVMTVAGRMFPIISALAGDEHTIDKAILTRDVFEMRRDAALTVLALHAFKQHTGAVPRTLAELSPTFLPRPPLDGADGQPLRYRLTDSGPLLYSIGSDGNDDHGRPPAKGNRYAANFGQRYTPETNADTLTETDGDWMFFPIPAEPAP